MPGLDMHFLRILTLLILSPLVLSEAQFSDLRLAVVAFEKPHDKFVRQLFGCQPEGMITPDTCNPNLGTINYGEFSRARKAAARLYDLKVPE